MAALNWMQQQFSETVPVTSSCSVKYLKNFHFQDCFGCWNIVAEWDAWINYHTYNFLIQEQTSLCLCVAKQGTACPEEEGMSHAYCPMLLPECEKAKTVSFLHCRKNDVKRNDCVPYVMWDPGIHFASHPYIKEKKWMNGRVWMVFKRCHTENSWCWNPFLGSSMGHLDP